MIFIQLNKKKYTTSAIKVLKVNNAKIMFGFRSQLFDCGRKGHQVNENMQIFYT